MFTGIVEHGEVVKVSVSPDGAELWVRSSLLHDCGIGASVAVNGVCLTVTDRDGDICRFDVIVESLERSTLGDHGVNTVMSEAGPHVAGALVRGGLVDRVLLLFSPVAGGDGPPALEGVPKASDLHDVRVRRLGNDLALEGVLG